MGIPSLKEVCLECGIFLAGFEKERKTFSVAGSHRYKDTFKQTV